MKKILPLILLILGILIFAGLYFFVIRDKGDKALPKEEETVAEIPLDKRPLTALIPSEDGHWLTLKIENIAIKAFSLDYELIYTVSSGNTQGVPGTVKLEGKTSIERELLLGSESSGKFRYDEGVETGTLTLRFRNEKGKLVGKLSTDFHLQNGVDTLSSTDQAFEYTLDKISDAFFVTMETFGLPQKAPGELASGPYGIFSSDKSALHGKVNLKGNVYFWNGSSWQSVSTSANNIGYFISVK